VIIVGDVHEDSALLYC